MQVRILALFILYVASCSASLPNSEEDVCSRGSASTDGARVSSGCRSGIVSLLQASRATARTALEDITDDDIHSAQPDKSHGQLNESDVLLNNSQALMELAAVSNGSLVDEKHRPHTVTRNGKGGQGAVLLDYAVHLKDGGAGNFIFGTLIIIFLVLCIGAVAYFVVVDECQDSVTHYQRAFKQDQFAVHSTGKSPLLPGANATLPKEKSHSFSSHGSGGMRPASSTGLGSGFGPSSQPHVQLKTKDRMPAPQVISSQPAAVPAQQPHIQERLPHLEQQAPKELSRPLSVDEHFCADMVVPEGSECVLMVPIAPLPAGATLDVVDVKGNFVLHMTNEGNDTIAMTAAQGAVMARCRRVADSKFQLLRPSGESYATLVGTQDADPAQYILETKVGARHMFTGSFKRYSAVMTDDKQGVIASTERYSAPFDVTGEYYRLRAEPLTDIGLILCSMASITYLESAFLAAPEFH